MLSCPLRCLRRCKDWKINFAGTTRTTFGFPKQLIDESLEPGEWKWLMTDDGLLAAYWSDVGFVKLMSNFHNPISGLVYRRVTGQADKTARDAPVVGVNYNDLMGGTDLNDWMRGLYTTARIGKKWWKCLFFWCLDASMINAFLLHKRCFKHLHPRKKYKPTFANFIHSVCRELTTELVPGTSRSRHRYTMPMHNAKSTKTTGDDYLGPNGEDRRARADVACVWGELERTPLLDCRGQKSW